MRKGDLVQAIGEQVVDPATFRPSGHTPIFHIVLHEPEIAANTGNIARTCAATGCRLHLIEPLGFSTDDRYLKRAGLDYWQYIDLEIHETFEQFLDRYPSARSSILLLTTKAPRNYHQVAFRQGMFLLFGKETQGLPAEILERFPERQARIPMRPGIRSLNLGNSVALTVYEGLRQLDFPGLE